jgi:hypothetical protein
MENKVHYVSPKRIDEIKSALQNDNATFLAEIDGKLVGDDYLTVMSKLFGFPTLSRSLDSYNDWMRDLDWLGKDAYVFIIHNYKEFLENDLSYRQDIIGCFIEIILPWWQEEVEKFCVGGKPKSFNVYLVVSEEPE